MKIYHTKEEFSAYELELKHKEELKEDRRRLGIREVMPRFDEYLMEFSVEIPVGNLKTALMQQENSKPFTYIPSSLCGKDKVRGTIIDGEYMIDLELRSNPQILEVHRQLYISNPRIHHLEDLHLSLVDGVEGILQGSHEEFIAKYETRVRPDSNNDEKGFFFDFEKLSDFHYVFSFVRNEPLKRVLIE